ncbi:MAG TPA: hypothetical protein VK047_12535 [Zeimonas sp.]|nr:hypothetical protein [Zeimonas sp.]
MQQIVGTATRGRREASALRKPVVLGPCGAGSSSLSHRLIGFVDNQSSLLHTARRDPTPDATDAN